LPSEQLYALSPAGRRRLAALLGLDLRGSRARFGSRLRRRRRGLDAGYV
jgi:hypothetical protein